MEGSRKRVKVYELNESSEWVDKGTGQCSCIYVERKSGYCLVVKSEETLQVLLESKILASDVYQRQQDTLIVWTEPDGLDLALSFQEATGCNEIWQLISDAQKKIPPDVDLEEALPKAELGNLSQIEQAIHHLAQQDRERLVSALLQEAYCEKLLNLFEVCEDLENTEGLQTLFYIVKAILILNERAVLDPLLKGDNILKVIGIMEYDPEYQTKPCHRDYLSKESIFRLALPLPDKEIENKIHQTYRIQYLKNYVLPRALDDNTFSSLNQITYINYVAIVSQLQNDDNFLDQLFDLLTKSDTPVEKRKDGIGFIQEFCSVAKTIQEVKPQFFRNLCKHGLLGILAPTLTSPDLKTRMACTDIIFSVIEHDPNLIRSFIIAENAHTADKATLFGVIIQQFVADPDTGMKTHLMEILRSLLDAENMDSTTTIDKNELINLVYEKHMPTFIEPLKALAADPQKPPLVFDLATSSLYHYTCELLCFFVNQHAYQIRSFILRNNLISKTQHLLRAKDKFLILAAIRFFRAVLGQKDDTFNGHIIQNKLFEPLFKVFESQKSRNNLVNSAFLELIEFLRQENQKKLISHIVESYGSYFEGVTYVDTFRLLSVKNDQNKDSLQNGFAQEGRSHGFGQKRKKDERGLEEEEEAYFNEDDDQKGENGIVIGEQKDLDNRPFNPPTRSLVDYNDDDAFSPSSDKKLSPPNKAARID